MSVKEMGIEELSWGGRKGQKFGLSYRKRFDGMKTGSIFTRDSKKIRANSSGKRGRSKERAQISSSKKQKI